MRLQMIGLFFALIASSSVLFAQTQAPVASQQTAREALVEMITGGEKGLMKHLTVEVQELLNKPENKQAATMLGAFTVGISMQHQGGSDIQTFATGSTLFAFSEPAQHKKLEVRVDNDDLSGDQDILELSLHSLRNGQEQPDEQDEWGLMSSHITVTMKKQKTVWRLSNVGVGIEIPLGDPEFLKKTYLKLAGGAATGLGASASSVHYSESGRNEAKPGEPKAFDPTNAVTLLALTEHSFARTHPDIGFTCSLPDLIETGKDFGLDAQIANGSFMGYKWSVSGCEGKPSGSFQVVAEPLALGRGAKAICTDATQNLRAAEDGRGASCLATGKVIALQNESNESDGESISVGMTSIKIPVDPDKPKP